MITADFSWRHHNSRVIGKGKLQEIIEVAFLKRRGFLRYFILEELAKDVDGYAFSNYVTRVEAKHGDET